MILLSSLYLLAPIAEEFSSFLHFTSHQFNSIFQDVKNESSINHQHTHNHHKSHNHNSHGNSHHHTFLGVINKFIDNSEEKETSTEIASLTYFKHLPKHSSIKIEEEYIFNNRKYGLLVTVVPILYGTPNSPPPEII